MKKKISDHFNYTYKEYYNMSVIGYEYDNKFRGNYFSIYDRHKTKLIKDISLNGYCFINNRLRGGTIRRFIDRKAKFSNRVHENNSFYNNNDSIHNYS